MDAGGQEVARSRVAEDSDISQHRYRGPCADYPTRQALKHEAQ
jgi:hypothetical protein